MGGGNAGQVCTFTLELILMTSTLTATFSFMGHYLTVLKIPALVYMFLDTISVMCSVTVASMILIFSIRNKDVGGAFSDKLMSEVVQGFSIVCCVMWFGLLTTMFIDIPRISSVPGYEPSSSMISIAIVIGLSFLIPVLSLIVTYTALPVGESNSLVFNGSTVGVFSILFFVIVSLGNGGAMKCPPYSDASSSLVFTLMVFVYWVLLYLVELAVMYKFNPIRLIRNSISGDIDVVTNDGTGCFGWFRETFSVSFWRIPGCVLNIVIVVSTSLFSHTEMLGTIAFFTMFVVAAHIPLLVTIKINRLLKAPRTDTITEPLNYQQEFQSDIYQPGGIYQQVPASPYAPQPQNYQGQPFQGQPFQAQPFQAQQFQAFGTGLPVSSTLSTFPLSAPRHRRFAQQIS
jgi:hypothetical protein